MKREKETHKGTEIRQGKMIVIHTVKKEQRAYICIRYTTTNEDGYVADIRIERKTVRGVVVGSKKTEKEMQPMQGAHRDCEETHESEN